MISHKEKFIRVITKTYKRLNNSTIITNHCFSPKIFHLFPKTQQMSFIRQIQIFPHKTKILTWIFQAYKQILAHLINHAIQIRFLKTLILIRRLAIWASINHNVNKFLPYLINVYLRLHNSSPKTINFLTNFKIHRLIKVNSHQRFNQICQLINLINHSQIKIKFFKIIIINQTLTQSHSNNIRIFTNSFQFLLKTFL